MKKICLLFSFFVLLNAFQEKKYTWVAIGDSITYLNDHADETANRVSKGYLTRVTEQLPAIQYVNQGHNGWTAVHIAEQIEKLGIPKADIYSVFLGTNDWWGGKPLGKLEDYEKNTGVSTVYGAFRVIMDKIHALNPDAKVLLITPMQRVDFVYVNNFKNNAYGSYKEKNGQQLEQFANAVKEIAAHENIPVVDLYHTKKMTAANLVHFKRLKDPATGAYRDYVYPDFIGIPFNPEKDEYPYPAEAADMTYDGLHPSDKGNEVIAGQLVKQFRKWVK